MSWKVDVAAWLEKPVVVSVVSDEGQSCEYYLEKTCKITRLDTPSALMYGWLFCDKCGPVYPPVVDSIADSIKYCPLCGAKRVKD